MTEIPRPRWRLLAVIVLVSVVAFVVTRTLGTGDHQATTVRSMIVVTVSALLLLVWLLAWSRLPARRRLQSLGVVVAVVVLFFCLFRVSGFTGNLVPIIELRFGSAAAMPVPEQPGKSLPKLPGVRDFPQFFGKARDGRVPGVALSRDWNASPPELLWRHAVGAGWSGFTVAGRRAITQEQRGRDETVVCYDVGTGQTLWVHKDATRYETGLGGVGPRASPTIDGDRVFSLGATGVLNCLELATGKRVWSKDIAKDNGAAMPDWGYAGSPLIHGKLVIVSAGGPNGRSLVAYDKATGKRAWGGGSDGAQYASPSLATLAGVEQVLVFNVNGVAGHDARTGKELWSYPWKPTHPHVCMPVPTGDDRVLISSGYGTGSHLVQIAKTETGAFSATGVWRSLRLKAKFTNVIVDHGFVYGLDDGTLTCIDVERGRRQWKSGDYGHGQILLVGDVLLVMAETGDVVLVAATPEQHVELARKHVFDRKTWNPPALAGSYLLMRTDREAACYRLPTVD